MNVVSPDKISLALAIIVKDNPKGLRKLLRSTRDVGFNQIVVVDTGSGPKIQEETKSICLNFGAEFHISEDPDPEFFKDRGHISDFSHHRNFSFSKCTTDYVMWLDSDDVLVSGKRLRGLLFDALSEKGIEGVSLYYLYSKDKFGYVDTEQYRERIVRREGSTWLAPVHEVIDGPGRMWSLLEVPKDWVYVDHTTGDVKKDHEKADLRNYNILERRLGRDGKLESRMWQYMGQALNGLGRYEEAIVAYQNHLNSSNSSHHIFMSLLQAGECYRKLGMASLAEELDLKALGIFPGYPQAWVGLCWDSLLLKNYEKALEFSEIGLTRQFSTTSYVNNPSGNRRTFLFTRYKALSSLGRHEESYQALSQLAKDFPGDPEIQRLHQGLTQELNKASLVQAFGAVLQAKMQEEGDEGWKKLVELAPKQVLDTPPLHFLMRKECPADQPSLAILCPPGITSFEPDSVNKGCGGSEEAVIFLAPKLAAQGFYVDVFHSGPFRGESGEGDEKHRWYPFSAYRTKDAYDILISWRSLPRERISGAHKIYVWFHDLMGKEHFYDGWEENVEKIIFLTKYHREQCPWVPEEKVMYSRNGISPDYFADEPRDPKRVIYASNPTRGLSNLLKIWKNVHARTGAILHTYYGFTDWHKQLIAGNIGEQKLMRELELKLHEFEKKGIVVNHGMVGQLELSKDFASSSIWAYPTQFPEISCITAMKAQAMGAVPVYTAYGALVETVNHGYPIQWEPGQEFPLKAYETILIEAILREGLLEKMRAEMIPFARKEFPWKGVAKQWADEFGVQKWNKATKPILEALTA